MNNSKTIFRILVFVVLFIPTYLVIYNITVISSDKWTVENTTKVTAVRSADNYTKDYTDSNDIKIFINALNDAKSVNTSIRNLDEEKPIVLTFYKVGEELQLELYLSPDGNNKDCLLRDENHKLMQLNSKDAETLLNAPISDTVYSYSQIPQAVVPQGQDNKTIYPSSGEWYLKKPDGKFYPSTVGNVLAKNADTNSIRIFKDKPLDIQFKIQPDNINIKVYDNKEVVFDDAYSNFDNNYSSDVNKSLQFVVTAEWLQNDTGDYYGSAEYNIDVSYEVPPVFTVSETDAKPGDIIIFTGNNVSDGSNYTVSVSIPGGNDNTDNTDTTNNTDTAANILYSTNFAAADGKEIALVPIGIDFAGKTLNVSISGGDEPVSYQINVAALGSIAPRNISARDDYMSNNLSPNAVAAKNTAYTAILSVSDNFSSKYWDGSFIYPREGTEWVKYGQKVNINGGTYSYISPAANLDVNPGDPILASNSGKVIYAAKIPDDGNLIVIDHGMGVKTWYGHLADIIVQVGDDITKGQQIGAAGNTGLYTSMLYNLYFAVSVKDIFVNPIWLIKNGISGADLPDSAVTDGNANGDSGSNAPSVAPGPDTELQNTSNASGASVSAASDTSGAQTTQTAQAQTSPTLPALSVP